jgi:hypothetical protein
MRFELDNRWRSFKGRSFNERVQKWEWNVIFFGCYYRPTDDWGKVAQNHFVVTILGFSFIFVWGEPISCRLLEEARKVKPLPDLPTIDKVVSGEKEWNEATPRLEVEDRKEGR